MTNRQTNPDAPSSTRLIADGDGPLHQRLAAGLRARIVAGTLRSGETLPPSRTLADELGVSRWVVTEAYGQLRAEGYLSGRVGSATRVAATGTQPTPDGVPLLDAAPLPRWDLSPALPDLRAFPRAAWRSALGTALGELGPGDLAGGDPLGHPALREAVATYLRRVRFLTAAPDRVQITQGVSQASWLLCHHLARTGARRIALEEPTWPRLRRVAEGHGLDVVGVDVDDQGMDVEALVRADRVARIDAVFVMPTHQFPTGVAMTGERRRELLEWANGHDRLIVEDDYDAELRYDRHPVGALASLDTERVVYLGSISKTLAPALRMGWAVLPAPLAPRFAATRRGLGAAAGVPEQVALAGFITSGGYERHLRRLRREYGQRRSALVAALEQNAPGRAATALDSGLHILWHLPAACDEVSVVTAGRGLGLALTGLGDCRMRPGPPGLVLGHAQVPVHRAGDVAALVGAAIREAV